MRLDRARFVKALSLDEFFNLTINKDSVEGDADWQARGKYLADRWVEYFRDFPALLDRRLGLWGTSRDKLADDLSRVPAELQSVEQLNFVEVAQEVLNDWASCPSPLNESDEPGEHWAGGLAAVAEPFCRAQRRLVRGELTGDGLFDSAVLAFMKDQPAALVHLLSPVVALEVNVARLLSGGASDPRRFGQVLNELVHSSDAAGDLFSRFPALTRSLVQTTTDWRHVAIEFAERLRKDHVQLCELVASNDIGHVTKVQHGSGDTHDAGRATCIVHFSSGAVVIYKPRPIGPVEGVKAVVRSIVGKDVITSPAFIDRGDYGWLSYVANDPCADVQELDRYYRRFGEVNAVLWFLGARDMHSENVIASGSRPVIVDLETLLAPAAPLPDDWIATAHPRERWIEIVDDLPTAIGMLPLVTGNDVDISVFGDSPDRGKIHVKDWANAGSDEVRRSEREAAREQYGNRPWLQGGRKHDPADYIPAVLEGFNEAVGKIRDNWSSAHEANLADIFSGDPYRALTRGTSVYAMWLSDSRHPDAGGDGALKQLCFERAWFTTHEFTEYEQFVAGEQHALLNGDVPIFYGEADSRALLGAPDTREPDFFNRSPVEEMIRRGRALRDPRTVERLNHCVKLSLRAFQENIHINQWRHRSVAFPAIRSSADAPNVGRHAAELAAHIGAQLLEEAWPVGVDLRMWIEAVSRGGVNWDVRAVGDSLYNGTAGISLFLDTLADFTGKDSDRANADLVTRTWLDTLKPEHAELVGAFEGLGGDLYRLARLSPSRWPTRNDVIDQVLRRMDELSTQTEQPADILSGSAGALLVLNRTAAHLTGAQQSFAERLRQVFARNLLQTARTFRNGGLGWQPAGSQSPYLLGFSHGCAGIAYALRVQAEDAATSSDMRADLRSAARAAEHLENLHFHPENDMWEDLRDGDQKWTMSWCNGSAGIGLARALTIRDCELTSVERQAALHDLAAAVRSATAEHHVEGDTICHGSMGVTELLLTASGLPGYADAPGRARFITSIVVDECRQRGGTPVNGHVWVRQFPGLISGNAGVGYQLLRVAMPARFPSVLSLDLAGTDG